MTATVVTIVIMAMEKIATIYNHDDNDNNPCDKIQSTTTIVLDKIIEEKEVQKHSKQQQPQLPQASHPTKNPVRLLNTLSALSQRPKL